MNILAVFAHPDDEVLAAGGCLAAHARRGDSVHVAILGEGVTSRHPDRERFLGSGGRHEVAGLQACVREAASVLGAATFQTFGLPDNRFDSVPRLEVIKVVEGLKGQYGPEVVYTHHGGDINVDHEVVANAVMTAFRSLPGEGPCQILAGEVLSSTDYTIGLCGRSFEPNVWVPLEREDVERKLRAMAAYNGELRDFPHPRSLDAIRALASLRGAQCGAEYGEAFRLLRAWGRLPGAAAPVRPRPL